MLRRFFGRLREPVGIALRDLAGLAGCGLITYGVWLVHQPSGFICAGILLLAIVFALSARAPGDSQ